MKKSVLLIVAALCLCLCLSACGGTENPNLGEYQCVARSAFDYDLGTDGSSIVLNSFFRGKLYIADGSYQLLWLEKEGKLTVLSGGDRYYGSVGNGLVNIMLGTISYTFAKPGAIAQSDESEHTDLQQLWNGNWYGYWNVKEPTGAWAVNDKMTYRCQALIDLDEYGQGKLIIWDEDCSEELPMADVSISVSADGTSAVSSGGYFWMADVTANEWRLQLYEEDIPQLIMLGQQYNSDEGGFRFELLLSRKQPEE